MFEIAQSLTTIFWCWTCPSWSSPSHGDQCLQMSLQGGDKPPPPLSSLILPALEKAWDNKAAVLEWCNDLPPTDLLHLLTLYGSEAFNQGHAHLPLRKWCLGLWLNIGLHTQYTLPTSWEDWCNQNWCMGRVLPWRQRLPLSHGQTLSSGTVAERAAPPDAQSSKHYSLETGVWIELHLSISGTFYVQFYSYAYWLQWI